MIEYSKVKDYFFYAGLFVIIIAGLKHASEIVVILLLAMFISSLLSATLDYLTNKGLNKTLSYLFILSFVALATIIIIYFINTTLLNFIKHLPFYQEQIQITILLLINYLNQFDINLNQQEIIALFDFQSLFSFTKNIIGDVGVISSKLLLVIIGVAFILSESKIFNNKLKIIFKDDIQKMSNFKLFSQNLQKYFIAKTFTSFLTGLFIYIALLFFDVKYAILWGFIAFLFNFIPVIGSIVAAIPALILSIISENIEATIWLGIIYVVINITISNILEPKLMGSKLNLSPMVIFFSLIFWGWVLGIVGMFLAVPIAMMIKIAFESSPSTRWISIILSNISSENKNSEVY